MKKRRTGFRLLGIAAGLLPVVAGLFYQPPCGSSRFTTRSMLAEIALALQNYQVETGHYPLMSEGGNRRLETRGLWLDCLLGRNPDGANPKYEEFLEAYPAHDGRNGLLEGKTSRDETQLVDRWGHPYVVLLSANAKTTANPDVKNASSRVRSGAPAMLDKPVLVFSLGPDGIEGTHDDIVSWRAAIPTLGDDLYKAWSIVLGLLILAVLFNACWQFFRLVQAALISLVALIWRKTT